MEREVIYLAALLHDIGKFYQRADENGATKSALLSQDIKNLESSISPKHWKSGLYTHKHVLWTAQVFENLKQHLSTYLNAIDGWNIDKLLRTSAAHHAPGNLLERIIQKADHYSSGIDRDMNEGTGWKDAAEESDDKWDSFKRTRMRSVFERISLQNAVTENYKYRKKLPLKVLSTDVEFFPVNTDIEIDEEDYRILWDNFQKEIQFIQNKTLHSFNDAILYILEKYTSRIPSSTLHLPDVSLYDHLKITAAFAISLYDYINENGLDALPGAEQKPFVLIGGSLSGIQKFIYNIVAKGAAKNLKGRSFYLELLVDNVVQIILDKLVLQRGNIIYASGGGFYIIAPNRKSLPQILKSIEDEIARKLFKFHETELYIAFDFVPFGEKEILNQKEREENISTLWKNLGEKLSAKKGKRFSQLIQNGFDKLFEPITVSPETKKDTITGAELGKQVKFLDDDKEQIVNYYTWQQIELGKSLKSADYWIISNERLDYFPDKIFCINPIELGIYNYLVDKDTLSEHENKLKASADNVRVVYFNKDNFLEPLQKGINNVYGFTWYGGNDFPENDFQEPKTFEELCGVTFDLPNYIVNAKRVSSPDLVRLGVLRMDVDNLGAIFRRGLNPSQRSFSRYSTLSRSLDWFFKGYLNTIWRKNENYNQFTQIIYSGGDDLFIVGKWDVLIKMATDIQQSFKKWVCENPELTLSGGMAIVGPKFPILKSAAFSDILEKSAKKHSYDSREKNAFAFMNYTPQQHNDSLNIALNWESEYLYISKLKDEIATLIQMKDGLAEGFTSAMFNLMQQAKMEKNSDGLFYPTVHRVTWLAAYQFKRSSDGKSEAVKSFLKKWSEAIMTGKPPGVDAPVKTQYHALQYLGLAGRWAALEDRGKIKSK